MSIEAVSWAMRQSAPATAKLILIALADKYRDGACWPTVDALRECAGVSEPTVKRAIAKLVELGLISKRRERFASGQFGRTVYTLHISEAEVTTDHQRSFSTKPEIIFDETRDQIQLTRDHLVIPGKDNRHKLAAADAADARERIIDLPKGNPDERALWEARHAEAHEVLGQDGSRSQGGLYHWRELKRLCDEGFDWDAEVVPTIVSIAGRMRRRGELLRSWALIGHELRPRRTADGSSVVPFRRGETAQQREDRVIEQLKQEGVI